MASSEAGLQAIESFSPAYTYPIFGDAQEIFGYKDLKISLQYHARDMRPCVSVTYGKKFKAIGETKPTDIEGTLKGFLPSGRAEISRSNITQLQLTSRQLPSKSPLSSKL